MFNTMRRIFHADLIKKSLILLQRKQPENV